MGHLPQAINIPLKDLTRRLRELSPKQEMIAYCRGPIDCRGVGVDDRAVCPRRPRDLGDGSSAWVLPARLHAAVSTWSGHGCERYETGSGPYCPRPSPASD
jgi:hypothetical protein